MIILNYFLFVMAMILGLVYFYNSKLLIITAKSIALDELCSNVITKLPFSIKTVELTKFISKEKTWETKSLNINLHRETKVGRKIIRINTIIPIRDLISEERTIQEAENLKEHFINKMNQKAIKPLDRIIQSSRQLIEITDKSDVYERAKIIIRESNTAINLFENIIVLANLQVNKKQNNREKIDCVKLLEDAKIKYTDKIQMVGKDIELILDQPYSESIIYPDINKLMLVIDNYLGNAVEYTNKGTIHFGIVHTEDNQVVFYVQDTGSGIPKSKQNKLFDNNELTEDNNHIGSGLGLSICKQIAINSEGTYGVVSEENEGAIFWMSIPLKFEYTEKVDYDWTVVKQILKKIKP
ncbi:MAG: HAMP domain-containing sensor histidine kinase [Bacteroidaceae bacterium]